MKIQLIAALVLSPFALAFLYAGIHEFFRHKSEGRATYGLVYDEATGTTHVSGIAEHQEAYNPDDFDPSNYREPDIVAASDAEEDEDAVGEGRTA